MLKFWMVIFSLDIDVIGKIAKLVQKTSVVLNSIEQIRDQHLLVGFCGLST